MEAAAGGLPKQFGLSRIAKEGTKRMPSGHGTAGFKVSGRLDRLQMLVRYKAWASSIVYEAVSSLPEGEAARPRRALFGSIAGTLNHIQIVDEIFRGHLEGSEHGHTSRHSEPPPFGELRAAAELVSQWYVEAAAAETDGSLDRPIDFKFLDGGAGRMSREEMYLHIVNHGTYHRGFVSTLLFEAGGEMRSNDLTIYLRDHR